MAQPIPKQRATKDETFKMLLEDFKLSPQVLKLFTDSPMETLDDFRYWFVKEDEIEVFLSADKLIKGQDLKLQASRLRNAWFQVRAHGKTREGLLANAATADMDDLIEEGQLRDVKTSFWARYKMR